LSEELQIRIFGDASLPALVYLPGLHGDWTLVTGFRAALANRVRFVEVTYPRSLTWTIADYANAFGGALLDCGIAQGWLLGESFGSQIAWALVEKNLPRAEVKQPNRHKQPFKVEGLVLAGGFVKHPWKHGPAVLSWIGEMTPMKSYRLELKLFAWYLRFRHRHTPELSDSLKEFVTRRTDLDRQAMRQRLGLLKHYDPRPVARQTQAPVYYLAGLVDPLVPWVLVRWWLRGNCPGYRGGKTFWLADHNVLATSPARAADLVVKWINKHQEKAL
jgi:pimeloyl-ACP methyl ester carboxylesterase